MENNDVIYYRSPASVYVIESHYFMTGESRNELSLPVNGNFSNIFLTTEGLSFITR